MSEIYRNTSQYVYLEILGGTADNVTAKIGDQTLAVAPPTTEGDVQRWQAVVDFSHTQETGRLKVEWDFEINGTPQTKIEYLEVVVPLVTVSQARDELDIPIDITDKQIAAAERRVRRVIERFCGQKFMPQNETNIIRGKGERAIRLSKRLVSVTSITDPRSGFELANHSLREDGWVLVRTPYSYDLPLTVTGPIFDPYYAGVLKWNSEMEWEVTGVWGWDDVPGAVEEAALILIEQNLCPESTYRDRYLLSMKAADWRFDYSTAAHVGTGNVIADQLLSEFRVVTMAVV